MYAIRSYYEILFVPVFILSACAIRTAVSFAANCSTFWLKAYFNAFPLMIRNNFV